MPDLPATPKPTKDDFHRQRSHFIDAFAILEEALAGHREPDSATAVRIAQLRAVRNDLVHAPLRFTALDGELQALVINNREAGEPARSARVVKLADFAKLSSRTKQIAQDLKSA